VAVVVGGYEVRLMNSIDMAVRHHYRPPDRPIAPRKDAHGNEWPIGSGWKNLEMAHRAILGNHQIDTIYKPIWLQQSDYQECSDLHGDFPCVRTPECVDDIMGIVHPANKKTWPTLCKRLTLRQWPLVPEGI
jgi:hypothetical protein